LSFSGNLSQTSTLIHLFLLYTTAVLFTLALSAFFVVPLTFQIVFTPVVNLESVNGHLGGAHCGLEPCTFSLPQHRVPSV
jgi:hypothetical protein